MRGDHSSKGPSDADRDLAISAAEQFANRDVFVRMQPCSRTSGLFGSLHPLRALVPTR
jgi:hypothetical protein